MSTYEAVCHEAKEVVTGVRQITYDQFVRIRHSGDPYILLDVLPFKSYRDGHIEGAVSFPLETITEENASIILYKDSNIIVSSMSNECYASTAAAIKLAELGYSVLDYKGGMREWIEHGNILVH
jgi:rhodanese-related sulfurtransferase